MEAIKYLVFGPILVHLLIDAIKILVKKEFVNHIKSGWITAGSGLVFTTIMVWQGVHYWWSIPIAMICFHFSLFSLVLNIIRIIAGNLPRKFISLWYLNDPKDGEINWWDAKLHPIPYYGRIVLYGIIFMVGVAVLNQIDCILDSNNCWYTHIFR